MTLDPDGYPFIALAAVPSLVARALRRNRLAVALGVLPVAMAAFFRDPDRRPDRVAGEAFDPDLVIAPADGRGITLAWQVENLAEIHGHLASAGIQVTPMQRRWGAWVFYGYDPEGHRLEFWSMAVSTGVS